MRPQAEVETTRRGSHRMATVGVLALLTLAAGCSSGDREFGEPKSSDRTAPPTTALSTATTTAPYQNPAVAAAVEAAYVRATTAEIDYLSQTGPFDPVQFKEMFSPLLTGLQYEASFQAAQQRRLQGVVFSPPGLQPGEIAPTVTVEAPTRATVRDCEADHPTVKAATGERVDTPREGRGLVIAEMVLEEGSQWKIAKVTVTGQACTL